MWGRTSAASARSPSRSAVPSSRIAWRCTASNISTLTRSGGPKCTCARSADTRPANPRSTTCTSKTSTLTVPLCSSSTISATSNSRTRILLTCCYKYAHNRGDEVSARRHERRRRLRRDRPTDFPLDDAVFHDLSAFLSGFAPQGNPSPPRTGRGELHGAPGGDGAPEQNLYYCDNSD